MSPTPDLRETIERRTRLAAVGGLQVVPVGVVLFVFGLGELGWHLGGWFLPTLAATVVAAVVGTVAAIAWYRRDLGWVRPRWDHRVTALVGTIFVGHLVAVGTATEGSWAFGGVIHVPAVTLGLLIAAVSRWSPYALAQHLVLGLLVAIAGALPLGTWIEMPVPPLREDTLGTHPHPLAVLMPLVVPVWLVLTGLVEHVRMTRALRQPVLADGQDAGTRP